MSRPVALSRSKRRAISAAAVAAAVRDPEYSLPQWRNHRLGRTRRCARSGAPVSLFPLNDEEIGCALCVSLRPQRITQHHCGWHCVAVRAARAAAIRLGSGAKALMTIRPVVVGEATIKRSAAVISSFVGSSSRCARRHEIKLDHAATCGAIIDGVERNIRAGIKRDRRIGRTDRNGEFHRAAREVERTDRNRKGRIHERHDSVLRRRAAAARSRHSPARSGTPAHRRPVSPVSAGSARSRGGRSLRAAVPPNSHSSKRITGMSSA